jgi:hypothetical protein
MPSGWPRSRLAFRNALPSCSCRRGSTIAILTEAGEALPIRVIAVRALSAKGVTLADRRSMKLTRVRLQQVLLRQSGVVLRRSGGASEAISICYRGRGQSVQQCLRHELAQEARTKPVYFKVTS